MSKWVIQRGKNVKLVLDDAENDGMQYKNTQLAEDDAGKKKVECSVKYEGGTRHVDW